MSGYGDSRYVLQILLLQTCQGDSIKPLTNPSMDVMKDIDTITIEQLTADSQAQSNNSFAQSTDARRGKPPEPPTINARVVEMRRPHTLLLMSAVAGGGAERGAFMGAMATALRQNKSEEIYNTFRTAVQLTGRICPAQTPKLESTLKKSLVLYPTRWSYEDVNRQGGGGDSEMIQQQSHTSHKKKGIRVLLFWRKKGKRQET